MKKLLKTVLLLLLLPEILFPFEKNGHDDSYSRKNIISFSRHLIEKGDYYRANLELDRLLAYYPDFDGKEKIIATKLYLLYEGKQFSSLLNTNLMGVKSPEYSDYVEIFKFDSFHAIGKMKGNYILSINRSEDKKIKDYLDKRRVFYSLFYNNDKKYVDEKKFHRVIEYYDKYSDELLTPELAFIYGIIPGMGYCYAGQTGTGIVALTTIGLGAFISYGANENNMEPLALLAGVVTVLFYGGSIIGGYMESVKHNENIKGKYTLAAEEELGLAKDRREAYLRFGIGTNGY